MLTLEEEVVLDSNLILNNIHDIIKLNSDIFDSNIKIPNWYQIFGVYFMSYNEDDLLDDAISQQIIKTLKDDIENIEEKEKEVKYTLSSKDNYEILIERFNKEPIYMIYKIYTENDRKFGRRQRDLRIYKF